MHGQCTHFVWLNRGKESVVADLTKAEDRRLFEAHRRPRPTCSCRTSSPARSPSSAIPSRTCASAIPRLICCSISGYGDEGPYRDRKAYDLLIQAESGLASVTGGPEAPARVGVSIVDICTGMNAYEAILEALIARGRTGEGADIRVSMFDSMMEWMAVPMLYTEYGAPPKRIGPQRIPRSRPTACSRPPTSVPILISIQNDREWAAFCTKVLDRPELARDPRFANNPARLANRAADRRSGRQLLLGARRSRRCRAGWRRPRSPSRGSTMSRPSCATRTCGA